MIIDFHTHVFPPFVRENRAEYITRDSCFSELYAHPKAKLATAEDVVNHMDECGVEKSVILNLGWENNDICVDTNDYIMEAVARFSPRLIGFCTVQPLAGQKAIEELERCARSGIKGIGEMRPHLRGGRQEIDNVIKQIMELAIEHDLIFLIHASEPVGHQYSGKGDLTPEVLYPLILEYPDIKFVCAHWGGGLPFYALMPEVEQALSNVFFDSAATPFLYKPNIFKRIIDIIGSDKILFGSDYPLLSPKRIIDQIETMDLSEGDKAKILGQNALRLLSIT
jgi:predicted TIM-barrel fold metal-dependent hydrolase